MNARDRSDRIVALLRKEWGSMADGLVQLAGFDRDKAWRELGYASLFQYLRVEVGLSAGAASYRKTAVELIQKVPEVTAALADGRLCMSSIIEVSKVLTPENQRELLPRFYGLSRREAEVVVVALRPAEVIPLRDVVTPIRTPVRTTSEPRTADPTEHGAQPVRPAELEADANLRLPLVRREERVPTQADVPPAPVPARPRDVEEPLTAELSRLHITVSRDFMETLDRTRDALSHSHPGASNEEILMACMELMLERKAKQKGLVEKPLKTPRPCSPNPIPAHGRREVMKRSGGRCEFTFANGARCNSAYQVEVDHIEPKALGGLATVEGCRAACRPHNNLAARRVFGDEWMDEFTREGRKRAPRPDRSTRSKRGAKSGTGEGG